MSSSNENALCSVCLKADLYSLINGRAKYTTRENEFDEFWDLSKVLNERNCPLCRLLISCFQITDGFDFVKTTEFDRIYGVYVGRELQVSLYRQGSTTKSSYSIQNCAGNNQVRGQSEIVTPIYFAVEELRSWLIRCDEGHRECKPSTGLSENPMPRGFRVIDVKRGCIVRGESDSIYCALSYVWGRVDQVVLNKLNLMELEKDRALFGDKFVLPKTILDAIKLCQDIGQTNLWVDSLCIIQDDEEDKLIQLRSMDTVYNRAFLTIIAATGDDANAGLTPFNSPRFNPDPLISMETISENTFVSSLSHNIAAKAIAKSTWATRGWTLQEYALSKRAVIFTGQYAFFRCVEALWGENYGLELSSFCDNGPNWDLPLYRLSPPRDTSRHYSEVYPQLVTEYVCRALTKEEDILNAFLGILFRLEARIGPHFWGLPSKEFGSALLWLSFPTKRRLSFPSWSWAGWIHDTVVRNDIYDGSDAWSTNSSTITCFKFGDDAKIECFEENNIDRIHQIHLRWVREAGLVRKSVVSVEKNFENHFTPPLDYEHMLDSYASTKNLSGPPPSHYVFFWTSCSKLRVAQNPRDSWKGDHGHFSVYTKSEATAPVIGSAFLDVAWRAKQPEMLEFAVTTFGVGGEIWRNGRVQHNIFLGLILIESCDETAPNTYRRIPGVSVRLDEDDWSASKPQQRLLALI